MTGFDKHTKATPSSATRQSLRREARRLLTRLVRTRWRSARAMFRGRIKSLLRHRNRGFLLRVLGDHAFALAMVAAVVSGGTATAAPEIGLSDVEDGVGGFVINGLNASRTHGWNVSAAGDVNGDGLSDVVVGTYTRDPGHVVFGKAHGTAVELSDVSSGTGGFAIERGDRPDGAGGHDGANLQRISGAGDVNGDGLDDVIVSGSYVVFGKSDGAASKLSEVANGTGGFSLPFGGAVSGAGDVNGDGLADMIISDWEYCSDDQLMYVVFGKADTDPVESADVRDGVGGFVMEFPGGHLVAGAGDVNGDGLDDLIVGLDAGCAAGETDIAYVAFGKSDTTAVAHADIAAGIGGFVLRRGGDDLGLYYGPAVSGAGDVNGDGLADFIIGAPLRSAGASYVVFGKADGEVVDLSDVASGTGGFVIRGIDEGDESGWSVSGAGDVNGDSLDDLIIGAPGAGSPGESYVVFGKADGGAVALSDVASGAGGFVIRGNELDESGWSVSGAGDVDGDGLSDLVIGAPQHPFFDGKDRAGKSYVVFNPRTRAPIFVRGDCNADGEVNVSDATCSLNYLFGGPAEPGCLASLNTNGDGDVGALRLVFTAPEVPAAPPD